MAEKKPFPAEGKPKAGSSGNRQEEVEAYLQLLNSFKNATTPGGQSQPGKVPTGKESTPKVKGKRRRVVDSSQGTSSGGGQLAGRGKRTEKGGDKGAEAWPAMPGQMAEAWQGLADPRQAAAAMAMYGGLMPPLMTPLGLPPAMWPFPYAAMMCESAGQSVSAPSSSSAKDKSSSSLHPAFLPGVPLMGGMPPGMMGAKGNLAAWAQMQSLSGQQMDPSKSSSTASKHTEGGAKKDAGPTTSFKLDKMGAKQRLARALSIPRSGLHLSTKQRQDSMRGSGGRIGLAAASVSTPAKSTASAAASTPSAGVAATFQGSSTLHTSVKMGSAKAPRSKRKLGKLDLVLQRLTSRVGTGQSAEEVEGGESTAGVIDLSTTSRGRTGNTCTPDKPAQSMIGVDATLDEPMDLSMGGNTKQCSQQNNDSDVTQQCPSVAQDASLQPMKKEPTYTINISSKGKSLENILKSKFVSSDNDSKSALGLHQDASEPVLDEAKLNKADGSKFTDHAGDTTPPKSELVPTEVSQISGLTDDVGEILVSKEEPPPPEPNNSDPSVVGPTEPKAESEERPLVSPMLTKEDVKTMDVDIPEKGGNASEILDEDNAENNSLNKQMALDSAEHQSMEDTADSESTDKCKSRDEPMSLSVVTSQPVVASLAKDLYVSNNLPLDVSASQLKNDEPTVNKITAMEASLTREKDIKASEVPTVTDKSIDTGKEQQKETSMDVYDSDSQPLDKTLREGKPENNSLFSDKIMDASNSQQPDDEQMEVPGSMERPVDEEVSSEKVAKGLETSIRDKDETTEITVVPENYSTDTVVTEGETIDLSDPKVETSEAVISKGQDINTPIDLADVSKQSADILTSKGKAKRKTTPCKKQQQRAAVELAGTESLPNDVSTTEIQASVESMLEASSAAPEGNSLNPENPAEDQAVEVSVSLKDSAEESEESGVANINSKQENAVNTEPDSNSILTVQAVNISTLKGLPDDPKGDVSLVENIPDDAFTENKSVLPEHSTNQETNCETNTMNSSQIESPEIKSELAVDEIQQSDTVEAEGELLKSEPYALCDNEGNAAGPGVQELEVVIPSKRPIKKGGGKRKGGRKAQSGRKRQKKSTVNVSVCQPQEEATATQFSQAQTMDVPVPEVGIASSSKQALELTDANVKTAAVEKPSKPRGRRQKQSLATDTSKPVRLTRWQKMINDYREKEAEQERLEQEMKAKREEEEVSTENPERTKENTDESNEVLAQVQEEIDYGEINEEKHDDRQKERTEQVEEVTDQPKSKKKNVKKRNKKQVKQKGNGDDVNEFREDKGNDSSDEDQAKGKTSQKRSIFKGNKSGIHEADTQGNKRGDEKDKNLERIYDFSDEDGENCGSKGYMVGKVGYESDTVGGKSDDEKQMSEKIKMSDKEKQLIKSQKGEQFSVKSNSKEQTGEQNTQKSGTEEQKKNGNDNESEKVDEGRKEKCDSGQKNGHVKDEQQKTGNDTQDNNTEVEKQNDTLIDKDDNSKDEEQNHVMGAQSEKIGDNAPDLEAQVPEKSEMGDDQEVANNAAEKSGVGEKRGEEIKEHDTQLEERGVEAEATCGSEETEHVLSLPAEQDEANWEDEVNSTPVLGSMYQPKKKKVPTATLR